MATTEHQDDAADPRAEGASRRTALAELLAQCRPDNRPDMVDFGPPVGRETL